MIDPNKVTQEELNANMDRQIRRAVLEGLENHLKFREQFIELLNKKDDNDKDIIIDIGLPPVIVDDNKMRYIIATGKRRNEYSQTPIQSMTVSKRLLKDLYLQLKEIFKNE